MNTVVNRIAALLVPVIAVVGLTLAQPSQAQPEDTSTIWLLEKPCVYEDSVNCYWDASSAGNGAGHSFVSRRLKESDTTCIFYFERRYAQKRDTCFEGDARSTVDLDGDGEAS